MKQKKVLLKVLAVFIIFLSIAGILNTTTVFADDSVGYIDKFNDLDDNVKYLGDKYRDNYSLDVADDDKILNDIANSMFGAFRLYSYIVSSFFYFTMSFDISSLFSTEIDSIQAVLKSSIFDTFFILAFAGAAWSLFKRLSKRDMAGLLAEIGKIILILVLSVLVVTNSSTVLSTTTSITKDISLNTMMGINGSEHVDVSTFAANSSGLIWKSLVHDPWITLQFGNTSPTEEEIDAFLSTAPGSAARAELVREYIAEHKDIDPNVMSPSLGGSRVSFLVVYGVPFIIKSLTFLFLSALQLAFQVMAVFFVIMAAFILLISMLPGYGIEFISLWLKKIIETQFMIIIITSLIGLIVRIDTILYSLSSQFGWFIVILMESIISVILALNYKKLLTGTKNIGTSITQPRRLEKMLKSSGDVLGTTINKIDNISNKRNNINPNPIHSNVANSTSLSDKTQNEQKERDHETDIKTPIEKESKQSNKMGVNKNKKEIVNPQSSESSIESDTKSGDNLYEVHHYKEKYQVEESNGNGETTDNEESINNPKKPVPSRYKNKNKTNQVKRPQATERPAKIEKNPPKFSYWRETEPVTRPRIESI